MDEKSESEQIEAAPHMRERPKAPDLKPHGTIRAAASGSDERSMTLRDERPSCATSLSAVEKKVALRLAMGVYRPHPPLAYFISSFLKKWRRNTRTCTGHHVAVELTKSAVLPRPNQRPNQVHI